MSATKGLLLLDVDGPLNPYAGTNKPRLRAGYRKYRITPDDWDGYGDTLSVWLRREHGQQLLDLAETTDLELVWATTWEDQANVWIAGKVGLPQLPVIHFRNATTWKFGAVLDYAAGRPLAWFDDDFHLFPNEMAEFMTARTGVPTLLHHVSPRDGLVDEDFAVIVDWTQTALEV